MSVETPSLLSIGRLLFALSVLASGIYKLVTSPYVNLVRVNPLPPPWQTYLGVLFVLIGLALLARRTVSAAAAALAVILLALLLGFTLPLTLKQASTGSMWVDPLMSVAYLGGVGLAVVPRGARDASSGSSLDRVFEMARRFAPWALGAFLVLCGVLHFPMVRYVSGLIPPWIPAPSFWTYFTGVALIAGGIGINVPRTARLAATLSGIMVFSWVFLVHFSLAVNTHTVSEVARGFRALQVSAVAFMLAGVSRVRKS